jgi:hypothetical protein|mmetsp:Transcript_76533/g.119573  ORF Transcript_76533/g.119573 Transcript_76533/m.119573 type:complete len:478 (-) Transcript_76533:32-1465(-)
MKVMANLAATSMFLFAVQAFGGVLNTEHDHIVSMPMYQYRQDCGKKSNLHIIPGGASLLQHDNVPGAGIDPFEPFDTVLKDGFMQVDCVKDYMYYRGDKFGDNKHDYKLGPISNVSIVHYDAFVAREDRQEMTQTVCFEFCRTVPNMGFFGIVNGRGCYCTPYFKAMASDSSMCDSVCEGETTLMCGGKSKSSVFAMHMCDSTQEDLGNSANKASSLQADIDAKVKVADGLSKTMQSMAAKLQKSFGAVGDSGASGLMQEAKQYAGTLEHAAEDAKAAADKLGSLAKESTLVKDFTDPSAVTKAERVMEDIDQAVAEGEVAADKLEKATSMASPEPTVPKAAEQYYPVMYFVDKEYESNPTTCSGASVGEPIVSESPDGCASACDAAIHSCVGFQYFKDGEDELCFLFSKFNTGFHYTGCGDKKSFLQGVTKVKAAPYEAKCYAKLSKFEGTTLKPDGSGKCDQCFKKLTKADRCYA